MNTSKIITIDGPAASGKGTLARRLADHLEFFYLDTGKIYRMVGLRADALNIIPEENPEAVAKIAKDLAKDFDLEMMKDPQLKSDLAGQMASRSSQFPEVREAVLDLQRTLAATPPTGLKGTVLDGRDCGTVICPDAKHKFYITAETEIRAKRRYEELKSYGTALTYDDILADMKIRDIRDTNREASPMKPADDAVIIDTSDMNADDAFSAVLAKL